MIEFLDDLDLSTPATVVLELKFGLLRTGLTSINKF